MAHQGENAALQSRRSEDDVTERIFIFPLLNFTSEEWEKWTEFIVNEKKGICAYRDQSPVASGRLSVDSLTNNVFF